MANTRKLLAWACAGALIVSLPLVATAAAPSLTQAPNTTKSQSSQPSSSKQAKKHKPGAAKAKSPVAKAPELVVTATRGAGEKRLELPQRVDVIGPEQISSTIAQDITDLVKKNSSVDVIQYPGALSGVSIRGFRPEYYGINKHYLLLVDGRPAGTDNLAAIMNEGIQRIEVLKGPASALYGGQAMGGVINIITSKSTGRLHARASAGYGSFDTYIARAAAGGAISKGLDFDINALARLQQENYTTGAGTERDHSSYDKYSARLRVGMSLPARWRLNISGDCFIGRVWQPGATAYDDAPRPSHRDHKRYTGEIRIEGPAGSHNLMANLYISSHTYTVYRDWAGIPEYHYGDSDTQWKGGQIRDAWGLGAFKLIYGIDYEWAKKRFEKYNTSGQRIAPYSPDSERTTVGYYVEGVGRFMDGRLMCTAGVRYDNITLETLPTPYKTNFTPGTARLNHTSLSGGINYEFLPGVRLHASIGQGFVPPDASQMAGYSEREVRGVIMTTKGNPSLQPEESTTWDIGITYFNRRLGLEADITYFHTKVSNKIERQKLDNVTTTYVNAGEARIRGWELEVGWDIGTVAGWKWKVKPYLNATYLPEFSETFNNGTTQDIHNVSQWKVSYGVEVNNGSSFMARVAARFRGEWKDTDWYTPGYPEKTYGGFNVVDVLVCYQPWKHHRFTLEASNIFNEFYEEKGYFPMPGRAIYLTYTFLY